MRGGGGGGGAGEEEVRAYKSEQMSDLGDLEGLDAETEARLRRFLTDPRATSKLYSYRWCDGFVAPWRPCSKETLDKALEALQPAANDLLADLGCGDGRVLVQAVKAYGCQALGVELDDDLLHRAAETVAALPDEMRKRIEIRRGDLFNTAAEWVASAAEGSVFGQRARPSLLVLYLLPEALKRLSPLLEPLLVHGTKVCTLGWAVPGWHLHLHKKGPGWHIYCQ